MGPQNGFHQQSSDRSPIPDAMRRAQLVERVDVDNLLGHKVFEEWSQRSVLTACESGSSRHALENSERCPDQSKRWPGQSIRAKYFAVEPLI
ncbi:hypothetical protein OIE68_42910 [Nocardia vinacea]|uniref:hypothetical protein n=1 Tax=Nocardia vinacea TaxID=96468 RepID=UPI002E0D9AE0|nr:hypothetical protein OIE68_42910 [Nocardia vinacea]